MRYTSWGFENMILKNKFLNIFRKNKKIKNEDKA
jgi:hypothetical protein